MSSVYNLDNNKSHLKCNMFLDNENEGVTLQRFEEVKYPTLSKMTDKQLSFFWRPEEVDLSKDKKDYADLEEHEKEIFSLNILRQTMLDSIQGRSPNIAFLPIVTLPELETLIETWSFFESAIHSKSYTHIIRNVYNNPTEVIDRINQIEDIVDCAKDISEHYDNLIHYNNLVQYMGGYKGNLSRYEHKRRLYLAMIAVNILEGIRFYVSFACAWAFAERNKMEGNAKIIKFIARDESLHLGITRFIINNLPKEDTDYKKIQEETHDEVVSMFESAIEQEKQWAKYLFKNGSMIGLTEHLLCDYVEWIGTKRMLAIGYKSPYNVPQSNPLPWTESWIKGESQQVAPQETEITSYLIGNIEKDVDSDFFSNLDL